MANDFKKVKREYNLNLKRLMKYMMIIIPCVIGLAVGLAFTNLNSIVSTSLIVVFGLVLTTLFEVIYYFKNNKKENKEKINPKVDPYG